MNQEICRFCGGLLIAATIGNFLICSHCGQEYKECFNPDLPVRQYVSIDSHTPQEIIYTATSSAILPSQWYNFPR